MHASPLEPARNAAFLHRRLVQELPARSSFTIPPHLAILSADGLCHEEAPLKKPKPHARLYPVDSSILEAFVKESLSISGIRGIQNGTHDPVSTRYTEVCVSQLNIPRLGDPIILNHGLLAGLSFYPGQYRTGIAASDHDVTPKAEYVKELCGQWYEKAVAEIARSGSVSKRIRERAALELFFDFLSIRPFKEANGRTARLLHNSMRVRMRLSWMVWRYEEFEKIIPKFRTYQRKSFVPQHRRYL